MLTRYLLNIMRDIASLATSHLQSWHEDDILILITEAHIPPQTRSHGLTTLHPVMHTLL